MPQQPAPTRLLVIDDDEMSRELLVALLDAEGYVASSAESGVGALALLESSSRPDIILTDMQMPGSTPAQLAGRLRRACGRSTLLLAMSGSRPDPGTLARYDAFLLKPFTIAQLTSAISDARTAHTQAVKKPPAARQPVQPIAPRASKRTSAILDLAASAAPASKRSMESAPQPSQPVPLTNPGAAPVLDESVYRQLAGSMPAPQLHEMYSMCITDARSRIADMRAVAAAHDSLQLSRQAHAIKGSSGMLGATEMHRIAASLEAHGLDTAGGSVNSLDELSAACDRLERMLRSRA